MQRDGILGPVQEFNDENFKKAMQNKNVDHVDVFSGTPEEIERRRKLEGKKYGIRPRFQKTGRNKK